MNIVYNCDDNYTPHTAVSIVSLFENNKSEKEICVYILGNGISRKSMQRFAAMEAAYTSDNYVRKITVLDLADFEAALKLLIGDSLDAGRFTVTALARIFAPQHLPDEVERYLYLDCDTAVTGSLHALFETGLEGNVCGMAAEPTIYREVPAYLGLGQGTPYFNTGMMLVDRSAWEEAGITKACVDYYREHNGRLPLSDQDVLNHCLAGKVMPLWQGWDFFSNYYYRSYKSLVSQNAWYEKIQTADEYDRARKIPAVIHFAGDERPWVRGNHNPWKKIYREYLQKTPWKDTPETAGQEGRMLLYHLMNLVTGICPAIRIGISEYYYRKHLAPGAPGRETSNT